MANASATARRMLLRQASGDFLRECCQMRMTFQPWRRSWRFTRLSRAMLSWRLLMLSPLTSSTLRAALNGAVYPNLSRVSMLSQKLRLVFGRA